MPHADRETRLAYLREYREKNKEKIRAQIKQIKHEKYGGICPVCGKKTSGTGPNDDPPLHCAEHRSRTWLVKKGLDPRGDGILSSTTNRGARFSRLKKEKNERPGED